ncbi:hypothetical protein ACOMHN_037772 [Nucella lapillus]
MPPKRSSLLSSSRAAKRMRQHRLSQSAEETHLRLDTSRENITCSRKSESTMVTETRLLDMRDRQRSTRQRYSSAEREEERLQYKRDRQRDSRQRE